MSICVYRRISLTTDPIWFSFTLKLIWGGQHPKEKPTIYFFFEIKTKSRGSANPSLPTRFHRGL